MDRQDSRNLHCIRITEDIRAKDVPCTMSPVGDDHVRDPPHPLVLGLSGPSETAVALIPRSTRVASTSLDAP